MSCRLLTFTIAALLAALPAGPAAGKTLPTRARGFAGHQLLVKFAGERRGEAVALPPEISVGKAAAVLRASPRVTYAVPNYIATASVQPAPQIPNDPGEIGESLASPGGWVAKQWNFLPWEGPGTALLPTSPGGIDAVGAWQNLERLGRPGAQGVTVAVLDTGIAYRSLGSRFRRSPDFTPQQFVPGYDFVGKDRFPLDENGHGTHVAGTIAEKTNNGIGLTGLAYRAKLMPVRVLNRLGEGRENVIAKGIRLASARHADVINMSFNFGCEQRVPLVDEALREARRAGIVTVAAVGNRGTEACVSPPATGPGVIGVGGTTEGGCLGSYSLAGRYVDLVAPGGGLPVNGCASPLFAPIFQTTFLQSGEPRYFGEPESYAGTSMSAAHVSGVAAMVIASGLLGKDPAPADVMRRLRNTARSIGIPPIQQGAGLIDAARATEPPAAQ